MDMSADELANLRSPFDDLVGTVVEAASADRAVARLAVGPRLLQPGGIVHGGVYATLVEVTASMGATAWLAGAGAAVGIANHTDFLRAVRAGELLAVATPVQRGARLQLWQVAVTDGDGHLAAQGTVRFLNLASPPG